MTGHEFGRRAAAGIVKSRAFVEDRIEIALCITVDQPPSVATVGNAGLLDLAIANEFPHITVNSVKSDEVRTELESAQVDYLLAVGLSELLPIDLLWSAVQRRNSASLYGEDHGCIGMHPTLLPTGRGRAPIPWTIIKGLKRTGVSVFFLEETADSGPIILQQMIDVDENETAKTLFAKVAEAHETCGKRLAEKMMSGRVRSVPQEEAQATWWARRSPGDSQIDFRNPASIILNLIRASTMPYSGAFFLYKNEPVVVDLAEVAAMFSNHQEAGTIIALDSSGRPTIAAIDGAIKVLEFRFPPPSRGFQLNDRVDPFGAPGVAR